MQVERSVIYLVRHAQVDVPPGTFYGQMDVPLSKEGERQSILAAKRIAGIGVDTIISSDLSRCTFLAQEVSRENGLEIKLEPALREINFGKWQGLSWQEIEERYPGQMKRRMSQLSTYRPPEGESLSDLAQRAWPVLEQCLQGRFGQKVAIIAHGGVNRVLMCRLLGMDLQNIFRLEQDYACLNRVDAYLDGPVVLRYSNCTCHLRQP